MKLYRLHKTHEAGVSAGFEFFSSKRDAAKAYRDWMGDEEETVCDRENSKVEQIEIKPTKQGILAALKRYASHADNG